MEERNGGESGERVLEGVGVWDARAQVPIDSGGRWCLPFGCGGENHLAVETGGMPSDLRLAYAGEA